MNPYLPIAITLATLGSSIWLTPDQQGQRAFEAADYEAAASRFDDPMWRGVALFRAGSFKQAQAVFAQLDTATAHFNRGNCLVFLGKYAEAVESYDRAIERRGGWIEAKENRDIAAARAEMLKAEGGDLGDQTLGADDIVFDKTGDDGQETQLDSTESTGADQIHAMWLRRVQTRPADFLKSKFGYQQQERSASEP